MTVVVAMLANFVIMVAKFAVATVSGSAAMFSEGVHSLVDTCNQGLLLYGDKRSHRPADSSHPFGYGKEVYFWALIYSVLLFGIGGGVSIYNGVVELQHPSPPHRGYWWSYGVLLLSFVVEGISWVVALRTVSREAPGKTFWSKVKRIHDPSRFVVFVEDSGAMLGVLVAAVGLGATQYTGSHYPDAIASIVIGVILCAAAISLTAKTRDLLVGLAAPQDVVTAIQRILDTEEGVGYAGPPLTMHLGPDSSLAAINVLFQSSLSAAEVARVVDRLESAIRKEYPQFSQIFVEAQLATADVERELPPPSEG